MVDPSFPHPRMVADIALVSLGTTPGLRRADDALAQQLRGAGASCALVRVEIGARAGRLRRQAAATDLVEALAARRAARDLRARAIVYSTVTAALLAPTRHPYAVRFDSPAALNRPGRSGAWQRARERRVLRGARLLLPWGEAAARALPATVCAPGGPEVVVLPVALDDAEPGRERDIDVIAYAGYPRKRGLELLCRAFAEVARPGSRLVVGGLDRDRGLAWLERHAVAEPEGVEWAGALPRADWLALVARARVLVNASRWEDHGLTQLEALAAGTALVTVPSPGAYEALASARALDPRLVAREVSVEALVPALRAGLALDAAQLDAYGARARELLAPYRRDAVAATLAGAVLPALGIRP